MDADQPREGPQSPAQSGGRPEYPAASTYGGPVPPGGWSRPTGPSGAPAAPVPGALAGWGRRLAATVVDGLIIWIPALALTAVFGVGVLATDGDGMGLAAVIVGGIVTAIVATVIALIYAPLLMMRQGERNGQTLGKQWLGIRVVRTDGQVLDFWWSALRDVGLKNFGISALSSFTFGIAFFVNYLWPLWDDRNRALHDLVAATLVVRA